jgi:Heavy metal binding domain
MTQQNAASAGYFCPMHTSVHQPSPGKCSKCGMDLIADGTRFGLLRHMMSNPLHLIMMVAVMVAIMAAAMMMMR